MKGECIIAASSGKPAEGNMECSDASLDISMLQNRKSKNVIWRSFYHKSIWAKSPLLTHVARIRLLDSLSNILFLPVTVLVRHRHGCLQKMSASWLHLEPLSMQTVHTLNHKGWNLPPVCKILGFLCALYLKQYHYIFPHCEQGCFLRTELLVELLFGRSSFIFHHVPSWQHWLPWDSWFWALKKKT